MAYNIKDVFYLDVHAHIANTTEGAGTAQLELSSYIDPIARGRSKGTGLAVYKVHWGLMQTVDDGKLPPPGETGVVQSALIAGLGAGANATGDYTGITDPEFMNMSNSLCVASMPYYGPGAAATGTGTGAGMMNYGAPSKDVPYVVVRDNVCLVYNVEAGFATASTVSCRLEVAQVTLDQATLNQLLRTQTV